MNKAIFTSNLRISNSTETMAYNNDNDQSQRPQVDADGIPLNEPSICIPRVFSNISDRRIFAIFRELRVGFVEKIDMVQRTGKDGKEYNMVFVHFRNWFIQDEAAAIMRERLLDGEQAKIIYDEPWFWKIHAYKPKPKKSQARSNDERRPLPFVDFEFREAPKRIQRRPAPPTHQAPSPQVASQPNIYSALEDMDETSFRPPTPSPPGDFLSDTKRTKSSKPIERYEDELQEIEDAAAYEEEHEL